MLVEEVFKKAIFAFNHGHSSVNRCLRMAIEAYLLEDSQRLQSGNSVGAITIFMANHESNGVAIVATGFKTVEDAEHFMRKSLYEAGK